MNVLNLIIKKVYFDQIIAGTKKAEYREIKPSTVKKYIYIDENNDYKAVKYDAVRLFVGYNKDRDSALVEVTGTELTAWCDDKQNPMFFEKDGETYFRGVIAYKLGKVLEKNIK